jgi:hypothetical protein
MSSRLKLVVAVAVLAGATILYGCATPNYDPPTDDTTAACEITAAAAASNECNADDLARQARDAADYKDEPALGYLNSPPGLLPVPVSARNSRN